MNGVEKRISLGTSPEVSLLEARDSARAHKKTVRAGQAPSVERRRSKERVRTFETVGREWLAKEQGQWTAHHRIATISRIERLIFPRIGSLPMDSIEPPDMLALCNVIKDGVCVYMAYVILGI